MPRLKAYLARSGYRSALKDMKDGELALAKEIYIEALDLAEPLAVVNDYERRELGDISLPGKLEGCASYSAMLFSLGAGLDLAAEAYFGRDEPLRALLLDSWGSEAVECLAENVDERLRAARGRGTTRFAPGYGGFSVRHNAEWLKLAVGEDKPERPVSVDSQTGIIIPRKSIICMIGWDTIED
jgi:hypothetical protein